jgi:Protein of unknown function (DUF3551)
MRCHTSVAVLATFSALAVIGCTLPAAAQDRYCLQGRQWGYPGNCQFASYAQCMATASGTDAYCGVNPRAYARAPREDYRDYREYRPYRDRY